jgi:transcriptional regulator with XRE-family HTH domain
MEFAERLQQAMAAKSIKYSPTTLMRLFNEEFDGKAVTPHSVRNWMIGKSMPTQDKLRCLANVLDTSIEVLCYGRYSEKTLMISNQDGIETELSVSQQQLVRKYIMLSASQKKLVSDLVDEISG